MFKKYYFSAWSNTFNYKGRATVKEYWAFLGLLILVTLALMLAAALFAIFWLWSLVAVFILVAYGHIFLSFFPNLSLAVRRLHDINMSGFWLFLLFVPVFGWFALFILSLRKGHEGDNKFGPSPSIAQNNFDNSNFNVANTQDESFNNSNTSSNNFNSDGYSSNSKTNNSGDSNTTADQLTSGNFNNFASSKYDRGYSSNDNSNNFKATNEMATDIKVDNSYQGDTGATSSENKNSNTFETNTTNYNSLNVAEEDIKNSNDSFNTRVEQLKSCKELLADGVITQEEFEDMKKKILTNI